MKIGFETSLKREENQPPSPSWWTRRVAVPVLGILAALALILALAASVLVLTSRPGPQTITGPQAPPSAIFLRSDTATQGAWKKAYGFGGYAVADDRQKFPAFARISLPDKQHASSWISNIEEPRALQRPGRSMRIASTWYSWTPFTLDVDLLDDKPHRLALYFLDWDSDKRVENIEILDGVTKTVLDHRQISKFTDGEYLVWKVSGHTVIRITPVAGANAVVSGLFLD